MAAFEPVDGGEDRACRGASAPGAGMKVPGLGFGVGGGLGFMKFGGVSGA